MSAEHSPARQDARRGQDNPRLDPVLSLAEVCEELGCSIWTFNRRVRPHVAVVEVSRKLRGVRRSELDRYIATVTVPAAVQPLEEASAT